MANTLIQIRSSTSNSAPQTLYIGEPAYSYVSNTLFIGTANGDSVIPIGGQSYIAQQQLIYNTANAAFATANTGSGAIAAGSYANAAFEVANSSGTYANAAFATANSAGTYANSSFGVANSAAIYANAAFAAANNSLDTWVRGQANAAFTQANAAFVQANTPSYTANSAASYANAAFVQANTATTLAQSAFTKANSANVLAQAAYDAANAAGSSTFTQAAFDKANSANVLAQASYNAANTVQGGLTSANANITFLLGNTSPYNYNTAISNTVNSIAVGGAPVQNAAVWKTLTIVQALDTILFPTLGPTYTIPTIVLTANNTGTFEIGRTINQSLIATGNKNDAGAFTQIRINRNTINLTTNNSPTVTPISNIAAQYGFANPNNQNFSYANTYTDSNTIVSGTTTWTGLGNYGAGLAKLTNKGTTDTNAFAVLLTTNPQSANNANFTSTNATITGIYPYFWGVSSTQPTAASIAADIQAGTATKVLAVGSGTLTITYNASSQYVWFAVQTTYAAKTTWFNTALNNGSIGAGQFILSPVTQAVTSPNAYWTGVNFRIYISGYATTTSGSLQFS
jgi:hypothetical protein